MWDFNGAISNPIMPIIHWIQSLWNRNRARVRRGRKHDSVSLLRLLSSPPPFFHYIKSGCDFSEPHDKIAIGKSFNFNKDRRVGNYQGRCKTSSFMKDLFLASKATVYHTQLILALCLSHGNCRDLNTESRAKHPLRVEPCRMLC